MQGWGAEAGRSRLFFTPWRRCRFLKKPGAGARAGTGPKKKPGAGAAKNVRLRSGSGSLKVNQEDY